MATHCKDCRAPIIFILIENTGRRLPVDRHPDPGGNVAAWHATDGTMHGRVLSKEYPRAIGEGRLFMPHAATCSAIRRAARPEPPPTLFEDGEAL